MKVPIRRMRARTRVTALMLTAALCVALFVGANFLTVSAYRSLSHIETIKQTESVFTVLELTPQAGAGSVGYYAQGQEPTADWRARVEKIGPSGAVTGPEARKVWADTLFQRLKDCGLLGNGATTPLTATTPYGEEFPWANDGKPGGTQLYLTDGEGTLRQESATVRGTFQYKGVDAASFDQASSPTLLPTGQTGTHVQHILHVTYATEQADGFYYYKPTFEPVDFSKIEDYAGKALYLSVSKDDTSNPTYGTETPVELKRYAGTLGQDGFAADVKQSYFYMTQTGYPSVRWSAEATYRAEADGFEEVSGGYFQMSVTGYTFMGSGKGNYAFTPGKPGDNSAPEVLLWYDHVYVTGGYQNNNWFLEHVFDEKEAALAIRVYSVAPGEIEPAALSNMLEKADLIVLSAGFDLANAGAPLAGRYGGANDLTEQQTGIVERVLSDGRPIWLDGRLRSGSARINQLADRLMGNGGNAFVRNSLYCFLPDTSGIDRRGLATPDFALPFDVGYALEGDPYYPVMAEISYENFLRSQAGGVDPLPSTVTMANCVRYIINYSGQRVQNVKTHINILEVQPNANVFQLKRVLNSAASGYNSPYNVFRWLPQDTFDDVDDVTITTMSTAEFIGKIEDINEEYDLVYLGDSTSGFYLSGGWPEYNDRELNGLLYTNIGDTYDSNLRLTGLLNRDYAYDGNLNTYASRSFRFSGNDITAKKQKELENFAASGFPVILASNLVNAGSAGSQAAEFTAQVAVSSKGGAMTLTAVPKLTSPVSGATYLYQWYSGTPDDMWRSEIWGADDAAYVPTTPGNYYCEIVLQTGDASYGVCSNFVTVQKDGWKVSADSEGIKSEEFYPIRIDRNYNWNGIYYYVEVSGGPVTNYQWYSRATENKQWQRISGANDSSYFFSGNSYYMCCVTINGVNYYSQQMKRNGFSYSKSDFAGSYSTTTATLSVYVGYDIRDNGVVFFTGPSITPSVFGSTVSCEWYNPDYFMTGSSTGVLREGQYSCVARMPTGDGVKSAVYTVSSGLKGTVMTGGTRQTIPGKAAVASTVNDRRVDNSSLLYETLNKILPKQNVMPTTEAMEWQATVLKYLNLSKPSVVLSDKPEEYREDRTTSLVKGQTLSYTFRILNPTDSTPASTRYHCRLYLDQNADGRYGEDEELTDLTITAGGRLTEADALTASTASSAASYTVKRTLPNSFSGVIPWKLEVMKVGAEQIHASQTGYTYIKPELQTLKILQISAYSGGGGPRFSLESQNSDKNSQYGKLFQELRNDGIYNIQVTSRSVSQINGSGWRLNASELAFDTNHNLRLETESELYNYLNDFNMLIIGFGDGYGYGEINDGLSETAAKAVVRYIGGNKAVLFTHDTTSYVNLPNEKRYNSVYNGQWNWGYYFNSVVRNAVGLDRYGVTDPTYGVTEYSPINSKPGSGLIANGYAGLDAKLANTLTGKGYSIAYEPGSGRSGTVSETQGYTALTMLRYSNDRSQRMPLNTLSCPESESGTVVKQVSQVNKGQITTFPYDLNATDFGGSHAPLRVGTTHEQYYQLNMNSDDVVVWYCLSGSRFDAMKNDGVNNYYIYNRGNVTYSGAGHSPNEVTEDEAKLFVNTMIAAYRAGAVNPIVHFTSTNGTDMDTSFLATEYTGMQANDFSGRILAGEGQSEERAVYFRLTDPNLAAGKTTSVELYYQDAMGSAVDIGTDTVQATKVNNLQLYRADSGAAVANSGLRSGVIYKVYLPDTVLDAFAGSRDASMKLYIRAITMIHETPYIGGSTLTLRKLGLLSLC